MIELSDKQRTQGGFQQLSKLAPFFRATRENANTLHEALRSSWKCCCNASHKIMLQLERKVERGEDEFNILCVLPSTDSQAQTQVRVLRLSLGTSLTVCVRFKWRVPLVPG